MNAYAAELVSGLLEMESVVGATLSWGSVTVPCVGGEETGGRMLDIGGFKLTADIAIVCRASVFAKDGAGNMVMPREGSFVTFRPESGAAPRKLKVQPNGVNRVFDQIFVFQCTDQAKGA